MISLLKTEWKKMAAAIGLFLACYYLPVGELRFDRAVLEGFHMVRNYAQDHVLLCLVPAFFIAGAISVFVSQASILKYLGAQAHKGVAYGVASVSGGILAVCSCTVLPLFAGIYRMGAGLGPAITFLYSGPAINILAIVLTAHVLGMELGIARAVGAVGFSIVIGLIMHFIYRKEEAEKTANAINLPEQQDARPLWQSSVYFFAMVGVLVFANWHKPEEPTGLWAQIYELKWWISSIFLAIVVGYVSFFMKKKEVADWFDSSWGFAKQILPLLLFGVFVAGLLLGRVGHEGLIPSQWVEVAVGGNSVAANFFASIAGAFMYFATLTEIPILHALMGSGMGKGPALALLLAGPALSLPNMLVIRSVIGTQKTAVYVGLVVIMATLSGVVYGTYF